MNYIPHGALEDKRKRRLKKKDYTHIAGSVMTNWVEKSTFKRYKQRVQGGSFSCVFQSMAKAIEVVSGKQASALEYFWRFNYSDQGAYLYDVGDIAKKRYFALETEFPSQSLSEPQMNNIIALRPILGITGYAYPAIKNIEQIAEAIEAYGQCLLTFQSNGDEWQKRPVYLGTPTTFGHCICGVDYGFVNGIKTIFCEDSAGQWSSPDGLRLITEDFLSKRNTGAMYITGVIDYSNPVAVHHTITTTNATIKYNNSWTATTWEKVKSLLKKMGIKFTETD